MNLILSCSEGWVSSSLWASWGWGVSTCKSTVHSASLSTWPHRFLHPHRKRHLICPPGLLPPETPPLPSPSVMAVFLYSLLLFPILLYSYFPILLDLFYFLLIKKVIYFLSVRAELLKSSTLAVSTSGTCSVFRRGHTSAATQWRRPCHNQGHWSHSDHQIQWSLSSILGSLIY